MGTRNDQAQHSVNLSEQPLGYPRAETVEFEAIIREKIAEAEKTRDIYLMTMKEIRENAENIIRSGDQVYLQVTHEEKDVYDEAYKGAQHQIKFLCHLNNALLRIANGTYGRCRITGQLIPKARLRLVPHATLTVEAKNMLEQQNKLNPQDN